MNNAKCVHGILYDRVCPQCRIQAERVNATNSERLRVALDALKGAPDVDRVMETAITTISEALA